MGLVIPALDAEGERKPFRRQAHDFDCDPGRGNELAALANVNLDSTGQGAVGWTVSHECAVVVSDGHVRSQSTDRVVTTIAEVDFEPVVAAVLPRKEAKGEP